MPLLEKIRIELFIPEMPDPVYSRLLILRLSLSPQERARMHELAAKNQGGSLTVEEGSELDDYNRVSTVLSIMKSKARKLLRNRRVS